MAESKNSNAARREEVIVSVIVCTYNREKFLPDCLQSLAAQQANPADFELIIVNNNSSDHTHNICCEFVRENPQLHITYVIEKNQGLSFARNRGIMEACGLFITYIDDDAIAEPDFVDRIILFFENYPKATAVGGKVLAQFEGEKPDWFNAYSASLFFSHYDQGNRLFDYQGKGYPIGCNMTFRRSFFDHAGNFDTDLGRKGKDGIGAEEKELFSRLIDLGLPYYYDPTQIVHHQIDHFRTQSPYTTKLARGLGKTHQKLYCNKRVTLQCLKSNLLMWLKMIAAIGLALLYLLKGQSAISQHLIWYRWTVLKGFYER